MRVIYWGALLGRVSLDAGDMQPRPGPRGASGQPQCQRWGASASLKPGSHSVSPAAAGLAGPEGETGKADTPTTNPGSVALSCPAPRLRTKAWGWGYHAHPPRVPRSPVPAAMPGRSCKKLQPAHPCQETLFCARQERCRAVGCQEDPGSIHTKVGSGLCTGE